MLTWDLVPDYFTLTCPVFPGILSEKDITRMSRFLFTLSTTHLTLAQVKIIHTINKIHFLNHTNSICNRCWHICFVENCACWSRILSNHWSIVRHPFRSKSDQWRLTARDLIDCSGTKTVTSYSNSSLFPLLPRVSVFFDRSQAVGYGADLPDDPKRTYVASYRNMLATIKVLGIVSN